MTNRECITAEMLISHAEKLIIQADVLAQRIGRSKLIEAQIKRGYSSTDEYKERLRISIQTDTVQYLSKLRAAHKWLIAAHQLIKQTAASGFSLN
jgi:hypothetical protein